MRPDRVPAPRRMLRDVARTVCAVLATIALAATPVRAADPAAEAAPASGRGALRAARVLAPDHVRVQLSGPLAGLDPATFRFTADRAPDMPIEIRASRRTGSGPGAAHGRRARRSRPGLPARAASTRRSRLPVRPAPWALLLTAVMSAALINNFVFTRYLGLCIFFGVSRKRDTAIGMGITFTMVMIADRHAVVGAVHVGDGPAQAPVPAGARVHRRGGVGGAVPRHDAQEDARGRSTGASGIYLVLITTNCIILAVPLLNAAAGAGPAEAFALALGAGAGFALALFLMSCAREKIELARVPQSFKGLPIAFVLAGLFALAFMGFTGLNFLR